MKNFPVELSTKIKANKIIATITIDEIENAVALADTLRSSGINTIEITLRTDCALDALEIIRKEFTDMVVGAGTVIFKHQVRDVINAGAQFAVAPGTNALVIEEAIKLGLPFAPGVATPSDIELAVNLDCCILKYFPAEQSGGITYLEAISQPYQHLGLQFIPLGGITPDNMVNYLNYPLILAIGGSWIAGKNLINKKDWKTILLNGKSAIKASNVLKFS